MKIRALMLSAVVMFGEVSAGNDVSKILTGVAVGVATGGVGLAVGAVATVGEAVAAGVVAGAATATGADRKVGISCGGNGKNARLETSFQTKEGREFTFRTNSLEKKKLNAQSSLKIEIKKEFEEAAYENQLKEDIYFAFNKAMGWDCSRLTSQTESYDCVSNGDSKILAKSGSRKWTIPQGKNELDSFSTFTPADEDGRKAVESFIFEETPLMWHFGRKEINGQWYNHAWTDTDKDILVPEGNKLRIDAPEWYTKQRLHKAKIEARETQNQDESKEIFEELQLDQNMSKGLLEEFLWSNVNALNLKQENRIEESRKAVQQGLNYYDEANRIYQNMRKKVEEVTQSTGEFVADIFLAGGIENFRKYANGELSEREYDQLVIEERLEDAAAIAIGAAWGAGAGGAMAVVVPVVGPATAPVTAATGAAVGATANYAARRITVAVTRALERTAQTNYRKSQNNDSENTQESKVQDIKEVKGKEPAQDAGEKVTNEINSDTSNWQVRKAKIKGKAQVTKTPGHEIGSMRIAVKESKKSDVEVIYMDKSLKDVTNGEISSRKRPDVTVVKNDGRIITHEVKSKSQTKTELRDKIDKMQKFLPENKRDLEGISDVFDVNGRKL